MSGYHDSFYTQAVGDDDMAAQPIGSYYQQQPEALTYPNQAGTPMYGQTGYDPAADHGYGQGGHGNAGYGLVTDLPPDLPPDQGQPAAADGSRFWNFWGIVGTTAALAGTTVGAYHGYKRNQSVGWALGWATFGLFLPFLALPIAIAQGVGKRKVGR